MPILTTTKCQLTQCLSISVPFCANLIHASRTFHKLLSSYLGAFNASNLAPCTLEFIYLLF